MNSKYTILENATFNKLIFVINFENKFYKRLLKINFKNEF